MINRIESKEYGQGIQLWNEDGSCTSMDKMATTFINEWCIHHGSTLEGRRNACAKRLLIKQKIPILISERTGDILFPTCNTRSIACVWINYRFVKRIKHQGKYTLLFFYNGEQIIIMADYRSIKRELDLCREYLKIIASSIQ